MADIVVKSSGLLKKYNIGGEDVPTVKKSNRNTIDVQRQRLLDGVVNVVAQDGMSGLSMRAVADYAGEKEMYLYRFFDSKTTMLSETFLRSDRDIVDKIVSEYAEIKDVNLPFRDRLNRLLDNCWQYAIEARDTGVFYVRYYYSKFLTPAIRARHDANLSEVADAVRSQFPITTDVDYLVNFLFTAFLARFMDFSSGAIEDNEKTRNQFYRMLCKIIVSYK